MNPVDNVQPSDFAVYMIPCTLHQARVYMVRAKLHSNLHYPSPVFQRWRFLLFLFFTFLLLAVWLSALASINVVALRQTRLVLG